MVKKVLLLLCFISLLLPASAGNRLRVACIGNSVTFGYGLPDRETQSYPFRLQQMLGDGYEVRNFGHSGATLLNHGHRPYTQQKAYQEALDFKADIMVVHLGLNDTDPRNWPEYGDEFNADYLQLIHNLRATNPKARIWICLMTPIFDRHPRFESGTRDWHAAIQRHIRQGAQAAGLGLTTLHTPPYARPDPLPDGLHPNPEGADILGRTVYSAITGNYGGLQMSPLFTDGMVMQRGEPVVFSGKANSQEKVSVDFNGDKRSTVADRNGDWSVTYPAMAAGGPYKAEVKAKSGRVAINQVFIGEVWLCSGQSNMEMPVAATLTAASDLTDADHQPLLHLFNMPAIYPTNATTWSAGACDSVNRHLYQRMGPWTSCTAERVKQFSAVAYHFGRVLADSLKVPVGVICNAVGGTTTESWIDRNTMEWHFPAILRDWYHGDFGQQWARERALLNIGNATNKLQQHPYVPTYMFASGISPLKGYTIKGVVWYQGESNAHNIELHERLFPLLEQSWRGFFHQPQLPFYTVQLSSLNRRSWPSFHNSQRLMATRLPHTWMTVTTDLGDSLNVHYPNKRPVGERLALQALHHSYAFDISADSPECVGAVATGTEVTLTFAHSEGLHASGHRLMGFEVAGGDGIYHPADARIAGDKVTVGAQEVPQPVSVRYAWQPFTRANLVNAAGLPCSTFEISLVP